MTFLLMAGIVCAAELLVTLILSSLGRAGRTGRRWRDALCRAPMLDGLVALMTVAPPVIGALIDEWRGLGAAIVGQIVALLAWVFLHELVHRKKVRGARLVKAQNSVAGRWRNHLGLWFSVGALPIFWIIRIGQIMLYPPLRAVMGFPRYRDGDWINISRHKFEGLVGHDLIWCLYCDWMTGIYSLGGEMLRNVESFWCPIRFLDARKCENCRVDFPDIDRWATPDGTVEPVVELFNAEYGDGTHRGWFGHPTRLTVGGEPVERGASSDESGDDVPTPSA